MSYKLCSLILVQLHNNLFMSVSKSKSVQYLSLAQGWEGWLYIRGNLGEEKGCYVWMLETGTCDGGLTSGVCAWRVHKWPGTGCPTPVASPGVEKQRHNRRASDDSTDTSSPTIPESGKPSHTPTNWREADWREEKWKSEQWVQREQTSPSMMAMKTIKMETNEILLIA